MHAGAGAAPHGHCEGILGSRCVCLGLIQPDSYVWRLTESFPPGVPHDYPDKNGKTPVELTRNPKTKKLLEEWAAKKNEL